MPSEPSGETVAFSSEAMRSFATTLENRIERRLRSGCEALEPRFFPTGRGEENRPFGRSQHHEGQRELGISQQRNVAAHLDELARLRDAVAEIRESLAGARTRFRDAEDGEQGLHQRLAGVDLPQD